MKKPILQLAEKIKTKNGEYILMKRTDQIAMYQHNTRAYEVFRIKVVNNHRTQEAFARLKKSSIDLTNIPEFKELYPRDEDFGKTAWYIADLKTAEMKYEQLQEVNYASNPNSSI